MKSQCCYVLTIFAKILYDDLIIHFVDRAIVEIVVLRNFIIAAIKHKLTVMVDHLEHKFALFLIIDDCLCADPCILYENKIENGKTVILFFINVKCFITTIISISKFTSLCQVFLLH